MKHLLSMSDVKDDVETILSIAEDLKSGKINEKPLEDRKSVV